MTTSEYSISVKKFFTLYNTFLTVDSIASISERGRYRGIINQFLKYFKYLVQKNIEAIDENHAVTKDLLKSYISSNQMFFSKRYSSAQLTINPNITLQINNNISNSFQEFLDAAEIYDLHRKSLGLKDITNIYKRNALDYHLTAFSSMQVNQEEVLELLDACIASKNIKKITMLKQALMEFNNAISHINSALKGQEKVKNFERAAQHLNRGTLDFYKSVIKELFILKKIKPEDLEELKEIRFHEFETMGSYKYDDRENLYSDYKKLCKKLIS